MSDDKKPHAYLEFEGGIMDGAVLEWPPEIEAIPAFISLGWLENDEDGNAKHPNVIRWHEYGGDNFYETGPVLGDGHQQNCHQQYFTEDRESPNVPTSAEMHQSCMHMRHDYGLMDEQDQLPLQHQCVEWYKAFKNVGVIR